MAYIVLGQKSLRYIDLRTSTQSNVDVLQGGLDAVVKAYALPLLHAEAAILSSSSGQAVRLSVPDIKVAAAWVAELVGPTILL
jgi:hypothetical protein